MFTHSEQSTSFFDKILFFIFQAVIFLSPIFFVPFTSVPFQIGKTSFIMLGVLVVIFGWALYKLKEGSFEIPKSFLYGSALIALATHTLATIFSGNSKVSTVGQGFELGTLGFFAISILVFLVTPLLVRTSERVFRTYTVIFVSAVLVALYQALRLFIGPDFMSLGVLTTATSNLIGKWNDLGVFFGFISLLSVITLERVALQKFHKVLVWIALVLSLFIISVVNFTAAWIVLSVIMGIFFIYEVSVKKENNTGELKRKIPTITMAVLIIACIFSFTGGSLGNLLAGSFNISQVEVRPSWGSTLEIAEKTLATDPVFGVGPNRFQNIWLLNKPAGINNTVFWNVDFNYGIGFIPSLLVTTGIVGFAGILLMIGLFILAGFRAVFGSRKGNTASNFLVLSSFFTSLYLLVFATIYVPSAPLWILMFVMLGLFVSAGVLNQSFGVFKFSSSDSQVKSFTLVLFCILILIGTVTFIYKTTTKTIANTYFQKGVIAINRDGNINEGERLIGKALSMVPSDVYNRFMSEIYLIRTGAVLNDKTMNQTELAQKFQSTLGVAIETARNAIAYDPTNYQNYIMLGRVYEAVVPLGVQGAYESAKKTYEDATLLNPENPELYLLLARLEIANKNVDSARNYITTSLKKKSDYVDAIFLLSQIEIGQGKLADALKTVEALAILSPNDPGVFFQLGLLRYNQKDYKGSTQAFERAVSINAQYANAKYFLGLSYFQTGNKAGAIAQFTDLSVSNPDNAEVRAILNNLEAGKSPFTNQADSKPEKRVVPPVREGVGSSQDF
jgi:cytochrome c-type biogenesis protein CcmH/NrfG